jgi:hypothetical protein
MTYRVYTGPPGTERVSPLERSRWLYKEFHLLDDALSFARYVNMGRRVALLIEGDDGTELDRRGIATALNHLEHEASAARQVN